MKLFNRQLSFTLLLTLCCFFQLPRSLQSQEDLRSIKRSRVIERVGENGIYQIYIPSRQPKRVLVIVHGTPGKNENTAELAKKFIERWTKYAKRKNILLIAPAFNQENFGSDPNTGFGYGGYRGLFGRNIGADEHVISLVDRYDDLCSIQDGRFLLYGHSAGSQFSIRFAVRHPERIAAIVASSPGRFAYPSLEAKWPYGMGAFSRTISWDPSTKQDVEVTPDPANWTSAASLPIAIVYGENDTEEQPNRPAHTGNTRISFAQGWVEAMKKLAPESTTPSISLTLIPDTGHSSSRLTIPCQKAFSKLKWIEPSPLEVYRKWTAKSGKFSVKAIFVSQSAEEVELQKSDGEVLKVEKAKLCDEDNAILDIEKVES